MRDYLACKNTPKNYKLSFSILINESNNVWSLLTDSVFDFDLLDLT